REATRAIELATGGDPDAGERARRLLVDLDATLSEVEMQSTWPKLEEEATFKLTSASHWIAHHGTAVERDLFDKTAQAVQPALAPKRGTEVGRPLQAGGRLGLTASFRRPEAWPEELEYLSARVTEFSEPLKARAILEQGRRATAQNDIPAVERAVRDLWKMLP